MLTPEELRRHAETCEQQALTATPPALREQYLEMARQWRMMADNPVQQLTYEDEDRNQRL